MKSILIAQVNVILFDMLPAYFSAQQKGKTYQTDNIAYICTSYGFSKNLLIEFMGKGHLTKNTTQSILIKIKMSFNARDITKL